MSKWDRLSPTCKRHQHKEKLKHKALRESFQGAGILESAKKKSVTLAKVNKGKNERDLVHKGVETKAKRGT